MTQGLQLLTVVAFGLALAWYGHRKGQTERLQEHTDPRQQPLFKPTEERELAVR
jgi:hypothetical protein